MSLFADKFNRFAHLHVWCCQLKLQESKMREKRTLGVVVLWLLLVQMLQVPLPWMWLHLMCFCLTVAFVRCSRPWVCWCFSPASEPISTISTIIFLILRTSLSLELLGCFIYVLPCTDCIFLCQLACVPCAYFNEGALEVTLLISPGSW